MKHKLIVNRRKKYTITQKFGRCIRYNLSVFFSVVFSPDKFRLFSWWEILSLLFFFAVTITMLVLSS